MTARGPAARRFPQTSLTMLVAVRGEGPEAEAALEEFARRYDRPVRAYLSALVRDRDRADELSQEFFATVVLSGRLWARYDRARGRFRPYLKQALRRFAASALRDSQRLKRAPKAGERYPDQWSNGWAQVEERTGSGICPTADAAFHEAWVRALLGEALARVRQTCEERDQTLHLSVFLGRYLSDTDRPTPWEQLGRPFGLDGKAARSRAETVAAHFRVVLREILVAETGSSALADEELSALLWLF